MQVAGDAGPLAAPRQIEELLLVTGNRAEVLVRLPESGAYRLVGEPVDRGGVAMGPMMAAAAAAGTCP